MMTLKKVQKNILERKIMTKVEDISKAMNKKTRRTPTVRINDLEKQVEYLELVVKELFTRTDNLEDLLIKLYDKE